MYLFDPSETTSLLRLPFNLAASDGTTQEDLYTAAEKNLIAQEAGRLYTVLAHGQAKSNTPRLLHVSAGAPGAGKTHILNALAASWADALRPGDRGFIYLDPDETVLKNMQMYKQDLDATGNIQNSYAKWRWASNYIMRSLANKAAMDGLNLILGTTAASTMIDRPYTIARNTGRHITTTMVIAPDDVRIESCEARNKTDPSRYIPNDHVIDKGKAFYPRVRQLIDASDVAQLYWRGGAKQDAVLAATIQQDTIQVQNEAAMNAMTHYLIQQKVSLASYDLIKSPRP